jgi:hypothetical protein
VRRAIFLIPGLRQKHISAHRTIPQRSKKNPNGPGLKVFAAALFHSNRKLVLKIFFFFPSLTINTWNIFPATGILVPEL